MSIGASRPVSKKVVKSGSQSSARSATRAAVAQAPRKRRSTGEVRLLILKTAADLFVKRGYDRTSTREIAEAAGIVEPMIFRHFGTKEQLFEHAVFLPFAAFVEDYIRHRQDFVAEGLSPQEMGRKFVTSLYRLLHENRGLIWELLNVGFRSGWRLVHTENPDSPFGQLFRQLDEISVRQMHSGQQRGTNPKLMTRLTFGSVLAIAMLGEWMFPNKKSRPGEPELIEELSSFLLYGISPLSEEVAAAHTMPKKSMQSAGKQSGSIARSKKI